MNETITHKIFRIINSKKTMKHLLAYLLRKTGLCRYIILDYKGINIRFHPAHLPEYIWIYGQSFNEEDVLLLEKLLPFGGTMIDIGANIGTLSLHGAKCVGPGGRVISFEPHPLIFQYLEENVQENGFKNITCYNYAVGSDTGYLNFSNINADDQNKISKDGEIQVPVVRLDDELRDIDQINLLKIDVEGYELAVLQGAEKTLARIDTLVIEVSDSHFEDFGYSTEDVINFLIERKFRLHLPDGTLVNSEYKASRTLNLIGYRDK